MISLAAVFFPLLSNEYMAYSNCMKKYGASSSSLMYRFSMGILLVVFLLGGLSLFAANVFLRQRTDTQGHASSAFIIPAATDRANAPYGAVLLNGGVGMTNGAAMNNGLFQVEAYCSRIGGTISQTNTDWYCGSTQLQVSDYDQICQTTYNNSGAFAVHDGSSSTPAYNWRCYVYYMPSPSPVATVSSPSPTPSSQQTYSVSDLNHNGKADTDDYRIFLEDYLQHLNK